MVCSTDDVGIGIDVDIGNCAKDYGVDVIVRPPELASDDSPTIDTVRHTLDCVGWDWDAVVVLQPTNPLRTATDIDASLAILEESQADSVISVVACDDWHPSRMYCANRLGGVDRLPWLPDDRRQEQCKLWLRDGSIYACRLEVIRAGYLQGGLCLPLFIPRERSVRIDEPLDLAWAEFLLTRAARLVNT